MIRNYLKTAIRNIFKYRLFSAIHIFGLSVSMGACLLIFLVISDQENIDNFNKKGDRIFRVITNKLSGGIPFATSPAPLADELKDKYGGIERVVNISPEFIGGDILYKDRAVTLAGRYASEDLFSVFDFDLEEGSTLTALKEPFSLVLSHEGAKKLFAGEDPMGKLVIFKDKGLNKMGIDMGNRERLLGTFKVTGVLRETSNRSHIQFDLLASLSTLKSMNERQQAREAADWENFHDNYLYVLARKDKDPREIARYLKDIAGRQYGSAKTKLSFELQPLKEITPGRFLNSPISITMPVEAIYFLLFMAILLLALASLNYSNLSIARAMIRGKEIGVRMVLGANKKSIFFQFICESIILSLIALLFAVGFLQLLKPAFVHMWFNKFLSLQLRESFSLYLLFILFSLLVGVVAGAYPAYHMSRSAAVDAIKGTFRKSGKRRSRFALFRIFSFRKSLTVMQFTFSLIFIVTAIVIYSEFRHLINADYGFDQSGIVNVKLYGVNYQAFRQEVSAIPGVEGVSACSFIPGSGVSEEAILRRTLSAGDSLNAFSISVTPNVFRTLGLKLAAGELFPEDAATGNESYIILNESAVGKLGYKSDAEAIGKLVLIDSSRHPVAIRGVVKNFQFELLMEIDRNVPLVVRCLPDQYKFANIKLGGSNVQQTLGKIRETWASFDGSHPFQYDFYDEQLERSNTLFKDLSLVVGYVAFLAISISCLGLLGMVVLNIQVRMKEIGIRKVVGAGSKDIVILFSKTYIRLLLIATLIALPVAYILNISWLEEFSYRINVSAGILLTGAFIMFAVAAVSVIFQLLIAARSNTIVAIKQE